MWAKFLITICTCISLLSCVHRAEANNTNPLIGNFHFFEFKKFDLQKKLPIEILLTFDLPCNYEFIKVIRIEKKEPRSQKTLIALGGVAQQNNFSSCAGINKEFKVSGGNAFSGQDYEIIKIRKYSL